MNIPGFTADASPKKATIAYRRHIPELGIKNAEIVFPQAQMRDWQHYACLAAAGARCSWTGPFIAACAAYAYDGCMGGFAI